MTKATHAKALRTFGKVIEGTPALLQLLELVYEKPGFFRGDYATHQDYKRDCNTASADGRKVTEIVWRLLALGRNALDIENTLTQRAGRSRWQYKDGRWRYIAGQYYCTEYRAAALRLLEEVLHDLQPVGG